MVHPRLVPNQLSSRGYGHVPTGQTVLLVPEEAFQTCGVLAVPAEEPRPPKELSNVVRAPCHSSMRPSSCPGWS